MGVTPYLLLSAGGSGYVQGVFIDLELSNGSMIGLEIGNNDLGDIYFAVGNMVATA